MKTKEVKRSKIITIAFVLITALILSLFQVASTYARYTTTIVGTGTATVAKWKVGFGNSLATDDSFNFNLSNTLDDNVAAKRIAPGSSGSFTLQVDGSETEVAFEYSFAIDATNKLPSVIKFYLDSDMQKQLSKDAFTGALQMKSKADIPVYWKWVSVSDADDTAIGIKGATFTFRINATATQIIDSNVSFVSSIEEINAKNDGSTLYLTQNITSDAEINITKAVNINLNNYNIEAKKITIGNDTFVDTVKITNGILSATTADAGVGITIAYPQATVDLSLIVFKTKEGVTTSISANNNDSLHIKQGVAFTSLDANADIINIPVLIENNTKVVLEPTANSSFAMTLPESAKVVTFVNKSSQIKEDIKIKILGTIVEKLILTNSFDGNNIKLVLPSNFGDLAEGALTINEVAGATGQSGAIDIVKTNNDGEDEAFVDDKIVNGTILIGKDNKIAKDAYKGNTSLTNIIIPSNITSIGIDAFRSCVNIVSVTFEKNSQLTTIDNTAFYGCENLTKISIPDSVTKLGYNVFECCSALAEVTIGNGLTILDSEVFKETAITSISIPDGVTNINYGAFIDCVNLATVVLTENSKLVLIEDSAFEGTPWLDDSIGVTDGVKYLGKVAYKYVETMPENTSIELKEDTVGIAGKAFYECSMLTEISIPDTVTNINYESFSNCTNLATVTLTENSQLAYIGEDAFADTAWTNDLSEGVNYLGKVAYKYVGTMPENTSIVLTEGTVSIAACAFQNCTGLVSITIPDTVTNIGDKAFDNCTNLARVTLTENSKLVSIERNAFNCCTKLDSIWIPDSVTSIGNYAFSGCSILTIYLEAAKGPTNADWNSSNCKVVLKTTFGWKVMADTSWYNTTGKEFTLSTAAQLAGLARIVNGDASTTDNFKGKTIKLANDVDLKDFPWSPIGKKDKTFMGAFDGGNNKISNLTVLGESAYLGFFGIGGQGGDNAFKIITNLKIENVNINANSYSYVGGLIGHGYTGTITNCTIMGKITIIANNYVGGLSGAGYAKITNCHIVATQGSLISGSSYSGNVGGLIGYVGETTKDVISDCSANIDVSGITEVGGLIGYLQYSANVYNSFATGNVTASSGSAGGLIGELDCSAGASNIITNCFATGKVMSKTIEKAGGLYGVRRSKTVVPTLTNCYYANNVGTGIIDQLTAISTTKELIMSNKDNILQGNSIQ